MGKMMCDYGELCMKMALLITVLIVILLPA